MSTSYRQQQPLERAVAKALARKAELRAARADQIETAAPTDSAKVMSTSLAPALADDRTTATVDATLTDGQLPETSTELDAAREQDLEESPRPRLPAAAMGLIERLANRRLDEPVDAALEAELSDIQLQPLVALPNDASVPTLPVSSPDSADSPEPVPPELPTIEPNPERPANDVELTSEEPTRKPDRTAPETAPGETWSDGSTISEAGHNASSGSAIDAFQLLLANNPDADDASRSDLREAPSMRNPRKALATPSSPAGPPASNASEESTAGSTTEPGDPPATQNERSFRNWFSPKQDPNPPPVPDQDPTLD